MGYVLNGLGAVLSVILNLALLVIAVDIVCSWIGDKSHSVVILVNKLATPIYAPFRKIFKRLPKSEFDWIPFIVILIIVFLEYSLVPFLTRF